MEDFNCNDIIENMSLAFAYNKVLYDKDNNPKDFIVLKTNKKFEEVSGFQKDQVIQKQGSNILDDIVDNLDEIIKLCGEVALNGASKSFEIYSKVSGNWYEVKVFSDQKGYFATVFKDITERKIKEEKLKEKNQRLNNIFNNSNDIIYSVSWPNLQIKTVSKSVKDIFGYKTEEFKEDANLLRKITHPKDKSIHDKALKKLKKDGNAKREFRIITKEGNVKWIYDKGKMIYDDNGNPVRAEGVMRDITERKTAEKKLRYNKKMYETIFNSAPIGIIIEDPKGNILKVNKRECEMTGYNKDELEGSNVKDKFVLPEYQKSAEKNIKAILNGEELEFDVKIPRANGEILYENLKETKITFPDGSQGILSMHIDITERKRKERKLKNQRKRMENTIEATEAGTFEWNIQTGKTIFNEKWAEMIGYTLDEISPSTVDTWKQFTHPDDLAKCEKLLEKHFRGETDQYKAEIRMKHKKGHWIWVLSQGKLISRTENGKPLKMFGTHLDITERKKRIKALKFQHDFQKNLADISSKLVGINNNNFDYEINEALKKIGRFFEIDRSYIFQMSENKKYVSNTHEWTPEGIESAKEKLQDLSVEKLPWLMEKLYHKKTINIFDVEKLDEKAKSEKMIFEEENIKSIVIIPIFIDNELFGFFGFDSVKRKRNFNQKSIDKIKIVTDVITSAFLQYLNIKRIEKLTYKDSLTGLYNRRYFEEEMERLDTKRQLPISIIMADINGLKIINDSYGHEKGDHMLIETGKILKEELRDEDILARHGGDEFTILLPQTSYQEAEVIITRLKEKNNKNSEEGITISFSLGVATKVDQKQDIKEVLKRADDDMYRNKLSESRSNKNKIVRNLLNTLDAKSAETKEHALRMNRKARDLGEKLKLSISEINNLSLLATLHDIGKTTISEEILTKEDKLTDKEWEIIKEHPARGYKIASASEEFITVAEDILHHHEHWDGAGYPDGLKGEEIPYLARIISIIDAYDVMTNDRPYSKAISKEEALSEIKSCAGTQFDPQLSQAFIELQKEK
jgi:diguanylate cyclase (GGDEF)-like protein/PAS domain S-box-containing protein